MFRPKLWTVLKEGYSAKNLTSDLTAGVIVGIVALPLAIAFAIASGVTPEKGLYTAIIAGFIISAFGGSRVQIGGPTGAFIVIVYGIVQQFGVDGLIVATFIAGIMLVIMGLARLGSVIKFIPHPLITGFTSGIALIIFSSQMKDFFGLEMGTVPAEFIEKWGSYFGHFHQINYYALAIGAFTVVLTFWMPRISRRIPGSLVAILVTTVLVYFFDLPVETIEKRFGDIPSSLPMPVVPHISLDELRQLIQPAFTIALLGGIESLLSAVVADGMISGNHRSNMELVAQGGANIASSVFGGIPATGAIARTVTNIKNGGRTPVAGIMHAITLLLIMLFFGKYARLIPLSCLAGILVVVAYNMSEWKSFVSILKGSKSDIAILLSTFLLTVLIDLTIAIEIGMVLAAFLFMRRMASLSRIDVITSTLTDTPDQDDPGATTRLAVPDGVEVYEINGPLFFGAAYRFKEALQLSSNRPGVLIIRMRHVPLIDATGLHNLKEFIRNVEGWGTKVVLSGVQPPVMEELKKSRILFRVGKGNVFTNIEAAISRAKFLLNSKV